MIGKKSITVILLTALALLVIVYLFFLNGENFRALNGKKVACEYDGNIYLFNSETNKMSVLAAHIESNGNENTLGVSYEQPSLSPDETKVICIARAEVPHQVDSNELIIVDSVSGKKDVLLNLSSSKVLLGSPIWSEDESGVYFLKSDVLCLFDLKNHKISELKKIPMPNTNTFLFNRFYIRADASEKNLFVLGPKDGYRGYAIYQYDLDNKKLTEIFSKESAGEMNNEVLLKQTAENFNIDKNAFGTLFGSIEYPVFEPTYSSDHRFYYFVIKKNGAPARHWLGAYDIKNKNVIELYKFFSAFYSE